jgi:tetratricopeptide (TPR) repeat protein
MPQIEKTVFISYRRTNMPWALAVYQNLTQHGYDVFFDYESINSGDFEQIILANIKARAHFIVILTPSALERCENPDDWLRREIEAAVDHQRNIVPLMLEGFNFGSPAISRYLTGKLDLLKKYNGLNVPVDYFDEAMKRLRDKYLNIALEAVIHPLTATASKAAQGQQVAANKATPVQQKELSAQEWFEQGHRHGEAREHKEAIRCYTEAIRLQPDYIDAYHNRGLAFYNAGQLEEAIGDYDKTIRLKPDYASAYNKRGAAREAQGDAEGAIRDYGLAIQYVYEDQEHVPYQNRGMLLYNKGEFEKAIQDFNKALQLKPDSGTVYFRRGRARKALGDLDQAIKDYDQALRLRPQDANIYWARGNAWLARGHYSSAVADYQKYFDVGGTDERVREYLQDARKKARGV